MCIRDRYSEVFFTSLDSDVLGLYDHLYECENIDELNELGLSLIHIYTQSLPIQ